MKRPGFTLIELLVVIAIIGFLSSIAVVNLNVAREKARIGRGLAFEAALSHAIGSDIIGQWLFDDATGTLDTSGNNNNLTFSNGASIVSSSCMRGTCLRLPASNSKGLTLTNVHADYTARQYTAMAWVKRTGVVAGFYEGFFAHGLGPYNFAFFTAISQANSVNGRLFTQTDPQVAGGDVYPGCNVASCAVSDGRWHHVAVMYNGTWLRYFLDGRQTYAAQDANLMTSPQDRPVSIGSVWGGWIGDIDSVRFYNTTAEAGSNCPGAATFCHYP